MNNKRVFRGDIWSADLGNEHVGSEQYGERPVCIIQNDTGNKYSPTTIVAMITSRSKTNIPTHMDIQLVKPSIIMLEQIRTIDKSRLINKIYTLSDEEMDEMDRRIQISFDLKGAS